MNKKNMNKHRQAERKNCPDANGTKIVSVSSLFADCDKVDLNTYHIYSEHSEWYSQNVSVGTYPFLHQYHTVTFEIFVRNGHGTDVDEYCTKQEIPVEEAVRLLREKWPSIAANIEEFESSCKKVFFRASRVIREHMADCEPVGTIYNSHNSTLIRAMKHDGSEFAVKLCVMDRTEARRFKVFLSKITETEDRTCLVNIDRFEYLENYFGDLGLGLIRMPYHDPGFIPSGRLRFCKYPVGESDEDQSEDTVLRAGICAARAMSAVHRLGYVLLDIRPENILKDGDAYLLSDIELIRPVSEQYEGHLRTSIGYRAPELDEHRSYDASVDIFAWGRSMLHLLFHVPSGEQERIEFIGNCKYPRLRFDGSLYNIEQGSVKEKLVRTAIKACDPNPAARFRNGGELLQTLEEFCPPETIEKLQRTQSVAEKEPVIKAETQKKQNVREDPFRYVSDISDDVKIKPNHLSCIYDESWPKYWFRLKRGSLINDAIFEIISYRNDQLCGIGLTRYNERDYPAMLIVEETNRDQIDKKYLRELSDDRAIRVVTESSLYSYCEFAFPGKHYYCLVHDTGIIDTLTGKEIKRVVLETKYHLDIQAGRLPVTEDGLIQLESLSFKLRGDGSFEIHITVGWDEYFHRGGAASEDILPAEWFLEGWDHFLDCLEARYSADGVTKALLYENEELKAFLGFDD